MINKWRAKINWQGIYNVRDPPKEWGDEKKENTVAVCIILETFCNQVLKK